MMQAGQQPQMIYVADYLILSCIFQWAANAFRVSGLEGTSKIVWFNALHHAGMVPEVLQLERRCGTSTLAGHFWFLC